MMTTTMMIAPATKALETYLKNAGLEYEKAAGRKFRIYTTEYLGEGHKEVDPMIEELLKHINKDCSIEGFYDADEASGCTMMFRFDYNAGELKKFYSEWIVSLDGNNYGDYEEFCEEFEDRFSEDEFDSFCEDEYYLLDGGDGDAVPADQVPMIEHPLCI